MRRIEKLISVIVPVYKVESYLEECLESILHQTYQNLEIILVEDGSPDNCSKICDEYARIDKRIKVMHQKNQGVSKARNIGIKYANGQYITFVDSDDFIEKDYIQTLYQWIIQTKADIAIGGNDEVIENGKIVKTSIPYRRVVNPEELMQMVLKEKYAAAVCWGKLYKASILKQQEKAFPEEIKIAEDLQMCITILEQCNRIIVDNSRILYHYRIRKDSITQQEGKRELWLQEITITNTIIKNMKKKHPKVVEAAIQRYVRINVSFAIQMIKEEERHLKEDLKQYKKNVKSYILTYILSSAKVKSKLLSIAIYLFPAILKKIWKIKIWKIKRREIKDGE